MNPDPLDPKLFPWSGSEIIFFSNPDQNATSLCINCSENTVECSFKVRIREATLGIVKICLAEHFASDKILLFLIISVADRSRNRVFRDCNSFRVPTETVALPGNIFGGVYVPGKYGKRVGFSRMLLQRGNVFIFKNNNCIISNLLELLFVHNYII